MVHDADLGKELNSVQQAQVLSQGLATITDGGQVIPNSKEDASLIHAEYGTSNQLYQSQKEMFDTLHSADLHRELKVDEPRFKGFGS